MLNRTEKNEEMNLPPRLRRELKTIQAMVEIYCRRHHPGRPWTLCQECDELLEYARKRLGHCPFQAMKPTCGKCPIHCYKKNMQARIREIMRFSGPKMIWHHPVMALWHLIDGMKKTPMRPVPRRPNNESTE